MDWNRFMMMRLMSIYRWAQLVRQVDSPELNLLPGVLVMHLSQHTFVSFPTISVTIALSFSCYMKIKDSSQHYKTEVQICGTRDFQFTSIISETTQLGFLQQHIDKQKNYMRSDLSLAKSPDETRGFIKRAVQSYIKKKWHELIFFLNGNEHRFLLIKSQKRQI